MKYLEYNKWFMNNKCVVKINNFVSYKIVYLLLELFVNVKV